MCAVVTFVGVHGWVRDGVAPSRNGAPGILPRKILEILYAKPCIFWNICATIGRQNGPILLCSILMLRLDVEVDVESTFFTKLNNYIILVVR